MKSSKEWQRREKYCKNVEELREISNCKKLLVNVKINIIFKHEEIMKMKKPQGRPQRSS